MNGRDTKTEVVVFDAAMLPRALFLGRSSGLYSAPIGLYAWVYTSVDR
jgi:hypothetical protein